MTDSETLPSTAARSKAGLLAMPVGAPRPQQGKHPLGMALSRYTNKRHSAYDAEFDAKIRKRQPRWFINTADVKKAKLLALPAGAARPARGPLNAALRNYTCKFAPSYDAGFDAAIRERQPGWFRK